MLGVCDRIAVMCKGKIEQLGDAPGSVIAPVGQGSFLLGMARGFEALHNANKISKMPQLVGVQSKACAPLWTLATKGDNALDGIEEGETIAEGIRTRHPVRGDAVLEAVKLSKGFMAAVDEQDIIPGRDELAAHGFYVEPTSAVVWPVIQTHLKDLNEPIVVVLTGSGLKYTSS